jgi:hypothetical protein
MDFIEKVLGIAPDGGDGTLEFWLFAVMAGGMLYLALLWRERRQRLEKDADALCSS